MWVDNDRWRPEVAVREHPHLIIAPHRHWREVREMVAAANPNYEVWLMMADWNPYRIRGGLFSSWAIDYYDFAGETKETIEKRQRFIDVLKTRIRP